MTSAVPRNARLAQITQTNRETNQRIARFRTDFAAGTARIADFAQLKQQFPYFGLVPCRAAGLDFVMFHANDDVIAWYCHWLGADAYEPDMVQTWAKWCQTPGTVLDIGGYSGMMSLVAALSNPANVVHLFEPMDRTVERANVNVKLNGLARQITLHHYAASDRTGDQVINLYRDQNFLGTGNSIHGKDNKKVVDRKIIQSVTIDSYLPDIAPTVVKVDVEGHELACLQGMRQTLERSHPRMLVEVWAHSRAAVLALLADLGYTLTRVEPKDLPVNNYYAVHP